MAVVVFAISGLTAVLCSALLLRSHAKTGVRLLFWSGLCFAALALESLVLIINEYTTADLSVWRLLLPLSGLVALLYGLLWEAHSR